MAFALLTVGLILPASCTTDSPSAEANPPNFVFVLTDDLDATYVDRWAVMPKTRALVADQGVEFSNAFVTSPVCCPSRATIHSGRYPHNSGVLSGTPPDGGYDVFAKNGVEEQTSNVRLQAAGYETAFIGKYLNGYEANPAAVPPGWDEWFGLAGSFLDGYGYRANHNGEMETYGEEPDDYVTDVIARQAQAFLERNDDAERAPFLLFLAPSAPHAPIGPAPRHQGHELADDPMPKRPNFNEADVSDKPLWIREGRPPLTPAQEATQTSLYRNGIGSLIAVDEMIDAVARQLRESGAFDNTVFIFTSDNGLNRGAHRLDHKTVPYEESLRVPLAMSGPGIRAGTEERFVTNLDYAPTMLDLAGLAVPDDIDGASLVPLLSERAEEIDWRNDFAIEFDGTYGTDHDVHTLEQVRSYIATAGTVPFSPTYRALRTEEWLYVRWYAGDEHDFELYDMAADPFQLTNLVATPEGAATHETVTGQLEARLAELEACAGPSCR